MMFSEQGLEADDRKIMAGKKAEEGVNKANMEEFMARMV